MDSLGRKVYCDKCNIETNHGIVKKYEEKSNPSDDFQWSSEYLIVQCLGCDNISFVSIYRDEDCWRYDDRGNRIWTDTCTVHHKDGGSTSYLPPSDEELTPLKGYSPRLPLEFSNVPAKLEKLYNQVVDVYNYNYLLLCSAGIRTLIEAICKELLISKGKLYNENGEVRLNNKEKVIESSSLEGKIYGLYEKDYIVWEQVKVLQTIREIGNTAVHEIKEPQRSDLKNSIIIIEKVLDLIYEVKNTRFHHSK